MINKSEDDFESMMIQNAKAGGDSSARAMIFTMLMVAAYGKDIIPIKWIELVNYKKGKVNANY